MNMGGKIMASCLKPFDAFFFYKTLHCLLWVFYVASNAFSRYIFILFFLIGHGSLICFREDIDMVGWWRMVPILLFWLVALRHNHKPKPPFGLRKSIPDENWDRTGSDLQGDPNDLICHLFIPDGPDEVFIPTLFGWIDLLTSLNTQDNRSTSTLEPSLVFTWLRMPTPIHRPSCLHFWLLKIVPILDINIFQNLDSGPVIV